MNGNPMRQLEIPSYVAICCWCLKLIAFHPQVVAQDASEQMRLRLKDGSFSVGHIAPSPLPDVLGWKCEGFQNEFRYDLRAVRALDTSLTEDNPADKSGFQVELVNGSMVSGELVSLDETYVGIDSKSLGQVQVARDLVSTIVDVNYAGQLLHAGAFSDSVWKNQGENDLWEFTSTALVAKGQDARIFGDIKLPAKTQVDLILSCNGLADFVLFLGISEVTSLESSQYAFKLETWDRNLTVIREVAGAADIRSFPNFVGQISRLEVTVYLDQIEGTATICDASGRVLGSLTAKSTEEFIQNGVYLINNGPELRLEKFEVREWDGHIATNRQSDSNSQLADGTSLSDELIGFDADANELLFRSKAGETRRIPVNQLMKTVLAEPGEKAPASEDGGVDTTANEEENPTPSKPVKKSPVVEVVVKDGSRFRGNWLAAQSDGKLQFTAEGIAGETGGPLAFTSNQIKSLVGTSSRFSFRQRKHRIGTLKIPGTQSEGFLLEDSPEGSPFALHWQPHGSLTASPILKNISGAIVYRRALGRLSSPANSNVGQLNRVITFEGRNAAEDDEQEATRREMNFRNGDSIDGHVRLIDREGVHFVSNQTQTEFASHDQMHSVVLNRANRSPTFTKKNIERLMTVPRTMKNDPPSHLFISCEGDYLRGRLLALKKTELEVEVRQERQVIPRDRIAEIVWLHDRNWESLENGSEPPGNVTESDSNTYSVHAIGDDNRGLTFEPVKTEGGILRGNSDLLGECSANLMDLSRLFFGTDTGKQVREFAEDPWTLSLAKLPKAFQKRSDEASENVAHGVESPLLGKTAPGFTLDDLSGQAISLESFQGRIVVLDFWASWCGPCMQTMPMVDATVQKFSGVQLVAINIQEPPSRATTAAERLKIQAKILLDRTGSVAMDYDARAIPQTVIIDPNGQIRHLFVGGGSRFEKEFEAALKATVAEFEDQE